MNKKRILTFALFQLFFGAVICTANSDLINSETQIFPYSISLDDKWQFCYKSFQSLKSPAPDIPCRDEFEVMMPVPGYWDDNKKVLEKASFWPDIKANLSSYQPVSYPIDESPPDASLSIIKGIGFYRKQLEVPEKWLSGIAVLRIGGAAHTAWVWLNGYFIGNHNGHSIPFEMSLNKALKKGTNEIVIAVANTTSQYGCDVRGWKGYSAGIERTVGIKVTGKPRISDLYLYPLDSNKSISWQVKLDGLEDASKALMLQWLIRNDGKILSKGDVDIKEDNIKWTTGNFDINPWSDLTPALYEAEVSVRQGGVLIDRKTQSFGLRTLQVEGMRLRLNTRPVMLRGVCECSYWPLTCTPPADVEFYRHVIRKYKETGFNWLRFHTTMPRQEYMQAADELGMMIQVEPPANSTERQWVDTIMACRNHPSVVIYCAGNEEIVDDEKVEILARWADICHELAPDRLFMPMESMNGVEYCWGGTSNHLGDPNDIIDTPFRHNAKKLARLRDFSDVFGAFSGGALSYYSGAEWSPEQCDRYLIYKRPCLIHEVGIHGNYLNLDLEHRYEGTRIGTQLFSNLRENLSKFGLLHKADIYYKNSCEWQRILRKHTMEKLRRCNYIAGYDFLAGIDSHWHRTGYSCGVMNEFYELKPGESPQDVLKYNGSSVVMIDVKNDRVLEANEKVNFEVLASLYGRQNITDGEVVWRIKNSKGDVLNRGSFSVTDVPNGEVTTIGKFDFIASDIDIPAKEILSVQLSGGEYEINNDWDFWVFPKTEFNEIIAETDEIIAGKFGNIFGGSNTTSTSNAKPLRIVSALTDRDLAVLKNGGTIILLGSEPFPNRKVQFAINICGRIDGNLATVIKDHPLFRKFPNDGFCDWQFYYMLNGAKSVNFNKLNIPFLPILDVVSSYKHIYKQAAVFELSVDAGKLLVCSLTIDPNDPAGMFLLREMLNYSAGNQFCPETKITIKEFIEAVGCKQVTASPVDDPNDIGYDPRTQHKTK